jgi:hypothetical protein
MEAYTTSNGTKIGTAILQRVYDDIVAGVDYQKTINDWLRDPIPVHDEDLDEANEVYNHVQELVDDASLDRYPCVHGHVLCASRDVWKCLDEYYANRNDK